ncbi:ROK family transcriptional regulator [Streptomyces apocyni]|uniref:ROK family transcriptional regulator n=1 Tax=Streptomyces apocyni TaxID=2654677 RepID=UPI0012E9A272|nr:ROK family transcriptional regulator [Streptomyces apocyni]
MKRTSRDIRTSNRYQVLRQFIAHSPASRQELAAATGLSSATVATLVGELVELGLVTEVGFVDSGGGRPRGLVALNTEGGALVGVDIAETYVHVELFDLGLNVVARSEERVRPGARGPEEVVALVVAGVHAVTAELADGHRVLGVGVSVPGQVDREGGLSVYAPNWDWHDVPLLDALSGQLAHPLYLDNPLHACTAAELWFGAARGRSDAVVVNLGTGVGAGLALGGALHRGVSNSAGEWGHTTLVLDGRRCHCGGRGCVETYVGAPGIMRSLRELHPDSALSRSGDDQTAAIDALARAVADGDPVAVATLGHTARYLGAALANLVNLLNPEVIILSSWVAARLGEPLLDAVREAVARHALRRPLAATEIVLSPIPTDPVCLGAATFALEGALTHVRTPLARSRR